MHKDKDLVIVVNHVQQFKEGDIASRFLLGLYKYYNDKSLRHVLQHYVDVANDKLRLSIGGGSIEKTTYSEPQKKFCITYSSNPGMPEKTYLMADVYPINCVTTLPLAPFKPRSAVEAEEMGVDFNQK